MSTPNICSSLLLYFSLWPCTLDLSWVVIRVANLIFQLICISFTQHLWPEIPLSLENFILNQNTNQSPEREIIKTSKSFKPEEFRDILTFIFGAIKDETGYSLVFGDSPKKRPLRGWNKHNNHLRFAPIQPLILFNIALPILPCTAEPVLALSQVGTFFDPVLHEQKGLLLAQGTESDFWQFPLLCFSHLLCISFCCSRRTHDIEAGQEVWTDCSRLEINMALPVLSESKLSFTANNHTSIKLKSLDTIHPFI